MSKIGKKEQLILNRIARKKLSKVGDITALEQAKYDIKNIPNGMTPAFETPEELETAIKQYVNEQKERNKPLTITWLALSMGLNRDILLSYAKKDKFTRIVNKWKQQILANTEESLIEKGTFTPWQIFYLKNNYKESYQDKIEVENKHSGSISLVELSRLADQMNESNVIEGELIEQSEWNDKELAEVPPLESDAS